MFLILGDRLYKDHYRVKDEISYDLGDSLLPYDILPERVTAEASGNSWFLSPSWTKKLKER